MESKYWFMACYSASTNSMPAKVHNIMVKCTHPLFHVRTLYHAKAIFWQEIEKNVARQIIEQGTIPFEEI